MARRGIFGRANRAMPDLSSTIVAIAREMQSKRDSNLMDAWKNGGLFEGKPATDEKVLAHWQERMKHVDKDDPLYDTYQNAYMQLDYSIHQSKAQTLYAQGKLSDMGMANFYLNWAKKIPQNTEFFRQLQQDGARFLEAARSKAATAAKAAKEKAYQDGQAELAKGAQVGNLLTWALEGIASTNSLIGSEDTKGLGNLSDPAHLMGLIESINKDPSAPLFQVGGVVWTGETLFAEIHKVDPSFAPAALVGSTPGVAGMTRRSAPSLVGGLTTDYIKRALQGSHDSLVKSTDLASSTSHKTDVAKYTKAADKVQETVREMGVWGVAPAYNQIIASRDRVLNDPRSSGDDKQRAALDAAAQLVKLASSPGLDMRTALVLENEARANAGDTAQGTAPTYGEDYLGTRTKSYAEGSSVSGSIDPETGTSNPAGSNLRIATLVENLTAEHEAVTQDPDNYTYTYGTRDKKTGLFTFDPNGTELGVASNVEVARGATQYKTLAVPQSSGAPLLVTVVGRPIKTVAYDINGNEIKTGRLDGSSVTDLQGATLGFVYTYDNGSRLYQVKDGEGNFFYTSRTPWADGASEIDNKDGSVTVDVSRLVQSQPFTGQVSVSGVSGKYFSDVVGPDATQYYDPLVVAVSAIRDAAGRTQNGDFDTPLIASLSVSDDARGMATWLAKDPLASQFLRNQEIDAASPGGAFNERLFAVIQEDSTRILSGSLSPNDADQPTYSVDASGNLVTRQSAVIPSRPLPPSDAFVSLQKSVSDFRARERTSPEERGYRAVSTGPDRLDPSWKPFREATWIKAPTVLRLPSIPAPMEPPPTYSPGAVTPLPNGPAPSGPTSYVPRPNGLAPFGPTPYTPRSVDYPRRPQPGPLPVPPKPTPLPISSMSALAPGRVRAI